MNKPIQFFLFSLVILITGCSKSDKLTITGRINNVDNDTLLVKRMINNQLKTVDQKVLKSSGNFKFVIDKQDFPQYYFLQINDNHNQLIVIRDSSDIITVNASASNLLSAEIKGSPVSVAIQNMMIEIGHLRGDYYELKRNYEDLSKEEQKLKTDRFMAKYDSVKMDIATEMLKDPKSYFCYCALYQRLDKGNLLFSPYNDKDYNYFAAVATAYDTFHKEDPRTKALYEMVEGVLKERRDAKIRNFVKNAPSELPDIVMNDKNGKECKLSDNKGKVVILNFWASQSPDSRDLNAEFVKLYAKYKGKGLRIYQVSADKSKILWEDAVKEDKISWTTVCDFKAGANAAFRNYNVQKVPTTYLLGREGEMINKFTNVEQLEEAIKEAL